MMASGIFISLNLPKVIADVHKDPQNAIGVFIVIVIGALFFIGGLTIFFVTKSEIKSLLMRSLVLIVINLILITLAVNFKRIFL